MGNMGLVCSGHKAGPFVNGDVVMRLFGLVVSVQAKRNLVFNLPGFFATSIHLGQERARIE